MKFSLDEPARIEADFYRTEGGKREFAGWSKWKNTHIGFNRRRFGTRGKHFKAKPGRYVAEVQAIDSSANANRSQRLRFQIKRGPRG